jgi:3-hydroxybutyryl-CoA dehydrogenase
MPQLPRNKAAKEPPVGEQMRMAHIGVVGAGLMGSEIALTFALSGHDVVLGDRDADTLSRAVERLTALVNKGIARGIFEGEAHLSLDRIKAVADLEAFAAVQYVTEAVFEADEVKGAVLSTLDRVCTPKCIFATNTSTIPISTLARHLPAGRRPNFLGTHYFSPVTRMKLVELIPGFETSEATVDFAAALLEKVGKTPIRVKDVAGFAVNRMLHAFMIEAVRLVEEGVATPEDLDTACKLGLGHPIGPFALMDAVTSSLCVQVQEIMHESYGERFHPPALLKQRVRAGMVGGKGNPGWLR